MKGDRTREGADRYIAYLLTLAALFAWSMAVGKQFSGGTSAMEVILTIVLGVFVLRLGVRDVREEKQRRRVTCEYESAAAVASDD